MSGLAWPALMRLGLRELRLSPETFWALTPAELMLIAGIGPTSQGPLTRSRLDALLAQFPDKEGDDG